MPATQGTQQFRLLPASAGSDGVQWQMDIPGLTNLLLGAGAYGLKQLALAGVDPHTIGCLLMIGELTPASADFRRRMNTCRRQQRAERSWLFKAIEIGAATNFLADELLKRRAGENVLALLSAVMPILSESSYTDMVSLLFPLNNVAADSTPGVGQLQHLRGALLSFAGALDIKNKVLQYHMLFRQYSATQVEHADPRFAVPAPETMAQLILTLCRLTVSVERYRLVYHGLPGAAWAASYACDVLGLETCILRHSRQGIEPIPISANYEAARVVFHLGGKAEGVELWKEGEKESVIQTAPIDSEGLQWTVDCDAVNFFNTQHPSLADTLLQHKISEFVAAKTLDCVAGLSNDLSYSVNTVALHRNLPPGLITYQRSVLPSVQKRALHILRALGLSPPEWETFEMAADGSTTGLRVDANSRRASRSSISSVPPVPSAVSDQDCVIDEVTTYWDESKFHSGSSWWSPQLELGFEDFIERWDQASEDTQKPWLDVSALIRTVKNAVLFASYLAFTDWHISLRRISVGFYSGSVQLDGGASGNINAKNNMRKIQMFFTAHPSPEPLFWAYGQELHGLVLLRHIPLSHGIRETDGILVDFRPGQIFFEGERCSEIWSPEHVRPPGHSGISVDPPKQVPHCVTQSIRLSTHCRLGDGRVFVQTEATQSSTEPREGTHQLHPAVARISPELVGEALSGLLITLPCSHGELQASGPTASPQPSHTNLAWYEGLTLSVPPANDSEVPNSRLIDPPKAKNRSVRYRVFYQAAAGHDLGQWLGLHVSSGSTTLFVMQLRACLDCTLTQVGQYKTMHPEQEHDDVCIITGSHAGGSNSTFWDGVTPVPDFLRTDSLYGDGAHK